MNNTQGTIQKIVESLNLADSRVVFDDSEKKASIFINDDDLDFVKNNLPAMVQHFNLLAQLIAKKHGEIAPFIDINNYRLERERLITELARAAARKVVATKEPITLPAMNAYERRLVHTILASHPEVKTESAGLGKDRCVTIQLV